MATSTNGFPAHSSVSPKMQFYLMTQAELTSVMAPLAGNQPCSDITFTHFFWLPINKISLEIGL